GGEAFERDGEDESGFSLFQHILIVEIRAMVVKVLEKFWRDSLQDSTEMCCLEHFRCRSVKFQRRTTD
ncbi:hypothetical protein NPIL_154971, partial [Nephila pilipes]